MLLKQNCRRMSAADFLSHHIYCYLFVHFVSVTYLHRWTLKNFVVLAVLIDILKILAVSAEKLTFSANSPT